jgi:hypothetical protein
VDASCHGSSLAYKSILAVRPARTAKRLKIAIRLSSISAVCYGQCGSKVRPVHQSGIGRDAMHAVTRSYSGKGAKELIDVLEKNKTDIEKLIKSIRG